MLTRCTKAFLSLHTEVRVMRQQITVTIRDMQGMTVLTCSFLSVSIFHCLQMMTLLEWRRH